MPSNVPEIVILWVEKQHFNKRLHRGWSKIFHYQNEWTNALDVRENGVVDKVEGIFSILFVNLGINHANK